MAITKGDVVLVEFPFTDLSQTKLRPAIVLAANLLLNEITVCFISSQKIDSLNSEEFALNVTDPEFAQTGLKVSSKVRVTRITTVTKQTITRRLGRLGTQSLEQLNQILRRAFQLEI